jgi:hypothetical protein
MTLAEFGLTANQLAVLLIQNREQYEPLMREISETYNPALRLTLGHSGF